MTGDWVLMMGESSEQAGFTESRASQSCVGMAYTHPSGLLMHWSMPKVTLFVALRYLVQLLAASTRLWQQSAALYGL
jgi:hypothetical protein